jgi:hypothetical protein
MQRTLFASCLFASVALLPVVAFAQQNPVPPDGTSMNEAPASGATGNVDACGNPVATATTGQVGPVVTSDGIVPPTMPATRPVGNTKDDGGAQQMENVSSVRGTLVHIEGDLILVQVSTAAATGNNSPGGLAVVRLPANCAMQAPLTTGEQVTAVGMPATDGILDAQSVQAAD